MQYKDYRLGNTVARYLINDDNNVALRLLPASLELKQTRPWEIDRGPFDPRANYTHNWRMGSLAHFYLAEQDLATPAGMTLRAAARMDALKLVDQTVQTENGITRIVTTLKTEEGYVVHHTLSHYEGLRGCMIDTTFENASETPVTLNLLSSFVLDGLSPFQSTDAPNTYRFHQFHAGWSLEGKHVCRTIEDMGLEKAWISWQVADNTERFGVRGSYPVDRYFPTAVFEDTEHQAFWAVQLAHNATWQLELGRVGNYMTMCGGLGDEDFCGWQKTVPVGGRFAAPTAFVAAVCGDIDDACNAVVDMQKPAYRAYGEQGVPTSFNEYCATWGLPTQQKMLNFADVAKQFGVKYLVIDAGWCKAGNEQAGNGEWEPDLTIFPDMKEMNHRIREMGMVPGIWFEMEVTTKGSAFFESAYDDMKLKRGGRVIKVNGERSYWDFRRTDVQEHLYRKVIAFLKEYGFGYIKVDYNANTGAKVDGADSGAEGLREHLAAVKAFFERMKAEIPDLVIENCASGGHRLEPQMMGVSAVSSFSDAHEAVEIPYIAASLHKLMLPAQELVWAVLHEDDSDQRFVYSLAATFLGRVCLSGPIDKLTDHQRALTAQAMAFYAKLEDVLINGDSHLYGNRGNNTRYPTGTQVLVRRTDRQMMVVCHAFDQPSDAMTIDIGADATITDSFYGDGITVQDGVLNIPAMAPFTASAVLLNL